MKVLVADDDRFFQAMLCQVLAADYEVVLASDGEHAWKILQGADPPRLAILDWVMPGFTGPQVCRKVRACPLLDSTYLIILTSKNNEADIVSGLRAGADDYITKPPSLPELKAKVRIGEQVLQMQDTVEAQAIEAGLQTIPDSESARLRKCPLRMGDSEAAEGSSRAARSQPFDGPMKCAGACMRLVAEGKHFPAKPSENSYFKN
jgi:DNA-binding response OmpR family regulator